MLNQHQTIKDNIAKYNRPNRLVEYLRPYLEGKIEAKILDIGSGPFCKIGNYLEDHNLKVIACDNQDFTSFYAKYKVKPMYSIVHQDMENLSYPDDSFDIVHCANALDHTKDAYKAVLEMIRVCKTGGWIYIDCCLDQMDTGHKHYWNAKENGVFSNKDEVFNLEDFGFSIQYIDNGGEKRYNHIIATQQK